MAKSLEQLQAQQKLDPGSLSDAERAQLAFLNSVKGKQRISFRFYDHVTIPAAGLGVAGTPATIQAFTGANAGNPVLTNFANRSQQLEQDEYADLIGVAVTPKVPLQIVDGVSAAALAANRARDIDLFIKNTVLTFNLGTNTYGPYQLQSLGGEGGLWIALSNAANIAAPNEVIFMSASNGEPKPGNSSKWNFFVRWPGTKP